MKRLIILIALFSLDGITLMSAKNTTPETKVVITEIDLQAKTSKLGESFVSYIDQKSPNKENISVVQRPLSKGEKTVNIPVSPVSKDIVSLVIKGSKQDNKPFSHIYTIQRLYQQKGELLVIREGDAKKATLDLKTLTKNKVKITFDADTEAIDAQLV